MQFSDDEMKKVLTEVAHNISLERKRRGISMAGLAERANLSVSHISKLESAQCEIGLRALIKISAAFGMKPEDFLPQHLSGISPVQTNGERFEKIMKGADPQTIEFILNISNHMVKVLGSDTKISAGMERR